MMAELRERPDQVTVRLLEKNRFEVSLHPEGGAPVSHLQDHQARSEPGELTRHLLHILLQSLPHYSAHTAAGLGSKIRQLTDSEAALVG